MAKYDLILSNFTDAQKTTTVLKKHICGLSDGHVRLMLKEIPLCVLNRAEELQVKRLAEELGIVGCTVKLILSV